MKAVTEITQEQFETEVVNSSLPVLVDFYTDWCMPCKMMAPVLEKLAGEFAGKAKVVKINIEEAPALAQAFQVRSIPTFVVLRDGEIVAGKVGMASPDELRQMLSTPSSSAVASQKE